MNLGCLFRRVAQPILAVPSQVPQETAELCRQLEIPGHNAGIQSEKRYWGTWPLSTKPPDEVELEAG
jgi:hypothetical protein